MRYERSSNQVQGTARLSLRARLLVSCVFAVVVAVVAYLVMDGANSYAKVSGAPSDVRATERVFLEANIAIENLGAPDPRGVNGASWILASHPISADRRGVVSPNYPWIDRSGYLNALTNVDLDRLERAQSKTVGAVFAGGARRDTVAELHQIIGAEVGSQPRISAPGGAAIVKWLKVQVHGSRAELEADVNVWESTPSVQRVSGRYVIVRSLNANQIDAIATLQRTHAGWVVVALSQAPWQQAT